MKLYLPKIYPDEMIYSWFSRYAIREGHTSIMQTNNLLYKKTYIYGQSKEFLGVLNEDTKRYLERNYGLENLIINHTMYPQYARYRSREIKNKMLKNIIDFSHSKGYVYQYNPQDINIKYCPLCAIEDRKTYNEAYWHRTHQIRDIILCPKHGCILKKSHVLINNGGSSGFVTAEESIPYTESFLTSSDLLQKQYTVYMQRIFNDKIDLSVSIPIIDLLNVYIRKRNYLLKNTNKISVLEMTEDIKMYYSKFIKYKKFTLSDIVSIINGNSFRFSTITGIAFFLGIPAEEMTNPKLVLK